MPKARFMPSSKLFETMIEIFTNLSKYNLVSVEDDEGRIGERILYDLSESSIDFCRNLNILKRKEGEKRMRGILGGKGWEAHALSMSVRFLTEYNNFS